LVQLRDNVQKLNESGVRVVGISYDSVEVLKTFSDKESIPFPLLSDEDSETIKKYGLHFKGGLPHPGTVLIDKEGVIRAKLFEEGYRTRHTIEELVSAAKGLK
jgi:peroxiredoxin Q/BCP